MEKKLLLLSLFLAGVLLVLLGYLGYKRGLFTSLFPQKKEAIRQLRNNESLIQINKSGLSPASINVARRQIIIFRNLDNIPHQLQSSYPKFNSPEINPDSEFSFVFLIPGKWTIELKDDASQKVDIFVAKQ